VRELKTDHGVRPRAGASAGQWNAYVAAGKTRDVRRDRLAECPPEFRASVESHVRTVFLVRQRKQAAAAAKAREAEAMRRRPRLYWEPNPPPPVGE
jgi:hypothetical protein